MRIKHFAKIVACVAAVGLALTGCSSATSGGSSADGEPVDGGTLTWAVPTQPGSGGLDPTVVANLASFVVLEQIYETLLTKDDDGNIQPGLATSYDHPDDLTYIYHLREGVTFSDGTPFTADDVVYTFEQYQNSSSGSKAFLSGLTSVTADDDHTVRFSFDTPNGAFVNATANRSSFFIVSKAWYSSKSSEERQTEAMGTGPYMLDTWNDNVDLTMNKNPNYWDSSKGHVDSIDMQFVPDENTRLSLAQQGQVDLVWFSDADVASQVTQVGYTLGEAYNTAKISVFVNPTSGALSDVRVRRALSLALDRQQLADVALNGNGQVSLFTVAGDPTSPQANDDTPYYTQNIDEAKELLAEAGQPNPTIELSYPGDQSKQNIPVYELMKEQAAEAGITINLVEKTWSEISRTFTYGDSFTDLVSFGNIYNADYTGYFNQYLSDSGNLNWWKDNSDADTARELLAQLKTETDADARSDLAVQLNNEVADKVLNIVAAAEPQSLSAWNTSTVHGFSSDPYTFFYHVDDLWLTK